MDTLKLFQNNQELYEIFVEEIIKSIPIKSGLAVDCGAHLGMHLKTMLNRKELDAVIAIEAIANLCEQLRIKFAADDRLRIEECALGSEPGIVEFNIANNRPGYSGIQQRDIAQVESWSKVPVRMQMLDKLLSEKDSEETCLIKMDIEGGEFDALKGAKETIKRGNPFIVFENGLTKSAQIYNYSISEFIEFWRDCSYRVEDFFGREVSAHYCEKPLDTYMFIAVKEGGIYNDWWNESRETLITKTLEH